MVFGVRGGGFGFEVGWLGVEGRFRFWGIADVHVV